MKICRFKTFRVGCFAKRIFCPLFFTIYILISVFFKDNSVEYGFDGCVEFYVETQQKMTETRIGNTLSKFTAIHCPWRKLRGGICRYETFCLRTLHVGPSCGLDIVVYMLKYMFC